MSTAYLGYSLNSFLLSKQDALLSVSPEFIHHTQEGFSPRGWWNGSLPLFMCVNSMQANLYQSDCKSIPAGLCWPQVHSWEASPLMIHVQLPDGPCHWPLCYTMLWMLDCVPWCFVWPSSPEIHIQLTPFCALWVIWHFPTSYLHSLATVNPLLYVLWIQGCFRHGYSNPEQSTFLS